MKPVIPAEEKIDLRRGIDHIGVSASFVIHDGNGRVLLHKRSEQCRDEHGRWDVGGGAIEFGESLEEAVRREVMEEFTAEPQEISFLTVYDAHRVSPDGSPTHWVAIIHAVRVNPNEVKIGEPHKIDDIGWFTSDQLPDPLHSQFWKSYKVALEKGIAR